MRLPRGIVTLLFRTVRNNGWLFLKDRQAFEYMYSRSLSLHDDNDRESGASCEVRIGLLGGL